MIDLSANGYYNETVLNGGKNGTDYQGTIGLAVG